MRLPARLENHIGKQWNAKNMNQEVRETLAQCPAISPHLLAHLRFKFQDPSKVAKPTNPQLAQLLTIQFGCDKVLNYLESQYDIQSSKAREDHEI